MPLVPYADPAAMSEEARATLAKLPVELNLFRMMANADSCFLPLMRLSGAILGRQIFDKRLRELVILEIAAAGGEYEWVQHLEIAPTTGVTQEQMDAIRRRDIEAPCFAPLDLLVLRFTRQLLTSAKAEESLVRDLSADLSSREIVELIILIGFYMMLARLTETTGTELDPPSGTRVVEALMQRVGTRG